MEGIEADPRVNRSLRRRSRAGDGDAAGLRLETERRRPGERDRRRDERCEQKALAEAPAAVSVLVKGSRFMGMERVVQALVEEGD